MNDLFVHGFNVLVRKPKGNTVDVNRLIVRSKQNECSPNVGGNIGKPLRTTALSLTVNLVSHFPEKRFLLTISFVV
jgi:hypothetical protein